MSALVLVDTGNLYYATGKRFPGCKIDYAKYLNHIEDTFGGLDKAIAYVSVVNHKSHQFCEYLKDVGFTVVTKEPRKRRSFGQTCYMTCWLVEMTLQASLCDYGITPTEIVLGSANMDLLPLLESIPCHVVAAGVPKIFTKFAKTVTELSGNWTDEKTGTTA